MRLAILIGHFPPGSFGGAEIQAERWAERLSARHEVTVITRRDPPEQPPLEARPGYSVVRLPVSRVPLWRTWSDLEAIERTVAAMSPRPELLLCFQTFLSGLAGVRIQRRHGIPAVVWIRGEAEYRFEQSRLQRWIGPWCWRHARGVLVQSASNRTGLLEAVRVRTPAEAELVARKLEVVGNGVALPDAPGAPGRGVLSVGRLIRDKGMDLVIEAAAAAGLPLVIAGDGPERGALEALARERGGDCRFEGFVGRERLAALYRECGVLVLAARRGEGLPNVVLEAMAHGRPVIATACAGSADLLVDAVSGRIVPADDAAAIRAALVTLRDDPARAALWGARARQMAEASSWEHWESKLESVLSRWTAGA